MGSLLSNLADALRAARIASGGVALAAIVVAGFAASCGGGRDLAAHGDDTGGGFILDDTALEADGPIGIDEGAPYAVLGVQPSHGPFNGGTRVEIRGRGFSSKTKVRFGATDVPAGDVTARDTEHVQVITPAGEPGEVDVQVRDEITGDKSLLKEAFTYDAFYAKPNSGATGGGTLVALIGRGTTWAAGTTATIDGKGCTDLVVDDATHLHCVAPAGTPGTSGAVMRLSVN